MMTNDSSVMSAQEISRKLTWFYDLEQFYRRSQSAGDDCRYEIACLSRDKSDFLKRHCNANSLNSAYQY